MTIAISRICLIAGTIIVLGAATPAAADDVNAISTGGKSPALAQQLREELSATLPEDIGPWLDALGEQRLRVLAALPASEERKQLLHELARREHCDPQDCPVEQTLNRILARAGSEAAI